jgi:hypothetical protein
MIREEFQFWKGMDAASFTFRNGGRRKKPCMAMGADSEYVAVQ